jgi:Na+/alanine symporter
LETGTVWLLAELMNGFMAIPNLICLGYLTPVLLRLIQTYKKEERP